MSAPPPRVREASLLASAAGPEGWPPPERPEVAFLGRSNVGKSSLLNRLVGRRNLARTSQTPGKTRLLHFYRVRRDTDELVLVDLPGYGYARVSQRERARWRPMIEAYLGGRAVLRVAVLLQDARRAVGEDETSLVAWLHERGIPTVVAVTKVDKLGRSERARRLRTLRQAIPVQADWIVETSAKTGLGLARLWTILDALAGVPSSE